jgi:hypothetical protein
VFVRRDTHIANGCWRNNRDATRHIQSFAKVTYIKTFFVKCMNSYEFVVYYSFNTLIFKISILLYMQNSGRAITQAVSRRLPTAETRVRAQVRSCGICGGQSGTGACFLRVHRFPLPFLLPPTTPHSSSVIRGWYYRPISGRRSKWTVLPHPTPWS